MREVWKSAELEEACSIRYGTRVVKKKDAGRVYPVFGGGGATFRMDTFNRENQLVVGRFGISEKCTRFVAGKFFLNDSGLTVESRDHGLLNQRFLDYQMVALNDEIYGLSRGTAQRNLDVPAFRRLIVSFPSSLFEQKRIVAILDQALEGIDRAMVNAEKNLANARELFESHLNAVFTGKGERWKERRLGDVCDFLSGFAFKSSDAVKSSNVQLIRMGNLYKNILDLDRKPSFYPDDFAEEYARYVLSEGDLIMSLTGTVDKEDYGFTVEIPATDRVLLLNQRIAKFINISEGQIDRRYFLHFLRSRPFLKELYGSARGVRQANLSSVAMKKLLVVFPELDEQQYLVQRFDSLEANATRLEANYQQKLDDLAELKQSILQKAFNGELTRSESEGAAA